MYSIKYFFKGKNLHYDTNTQSLKDTCFDQLLLRYKKVRQKEECDIQ